ncbi:phosphoadenosine phosphosulfate reductase domain-containing protein [Plastoroseomonas hellenica]|uniref:Phosphoadenosine phosphosulfate reductase family protein n=1 Tax=Plastoroseomonas hellenica TaxID=2687306 RepID=A0ABS5EWP2_9PROT|nr:phosphoadenosine phosphosulfate reductase family protein [Plastoroseomonas hellenica]MBR0641258.1 phosphoadenosine phosphosulfate reductase family protein [Plastoroseomonas hellenica]MBR0664727.1 phosphoadenosine phosphosulfate reductase family protein [Plastoroseomonas hellenica]
MRGPSLPPRAKPDLASYDTILIFTSGGKDSLCCLLHLLERGVDRRRIELHHHEVDGRGAWFMDWPVTGAYVAATAAAFGLPLYRSWRVGGFEREMLRRDAATAPVLFETPLGLAQAGGAGRLGTRLAFPQISADPSVRWCSPALKIDVGAAVIRNQDRFLGQRLLVVTGERAEESPARARYATFEPHGTDTRGGRRRPRHVDHWRPVHGWSTACVWDTVGRHGVRPHPAYELGWARLSCMSCIFGTAAQWATIRLIAPEVFERIARYEELFGRTIQRARSIRDLAALGRPYQAAIDNPGLVALALGDSWPLPIRGSPEDWVMPAGAFAERSGPT